MHGNVTRRQVIQGAALVGAVVTTGQPALSQGSSAAPPVRPKVRWTEMLPDELLEAIRPHPICYCAYGLAEPHGPYCALGLDWIKAEGIVERAARQHGGVVAPSFAWHVQDRPYFDWLGQRGVRQTLCSAIPADLWLRMALYQIRAIDARGFHGGVLITGHYGGLEKDLRLLCEYYRRRTGSPLQLFAAADAELIHVPGYAGDHAGITETSQLMALRPKLVDLSRKAEGWPSGRWAGCDFPLPDGRSPNAEIGERIVASQIARLGEIQTQLLAAFKPRENWQAPSLTDAESIWHRFESLTRKYWWCSLTLEENDQHKDLTFPGWPALGE
ncbi:MAG: creatininase family protein [Planctomycetes bacterium]|nr:creatininase family protein [Planctomycetota bacterium]